MEFCHRLSDAPNTFAPPQIHHHLLLTLLLLPASAEPGLRVLCQRRAIRYGLEVSSIRCIHFNRFYSGFCCEHLLHRSGGYSLFENCAPSVDGSVFVLLRGAALIYNLTQRRHRRRAKHVCRHPSPTRTQHSQPHITHTSRAAHLLVIITHWLRQRTFDFELCGVYLDDYIYIIYIFGVFGCETSSSRVESYAARASCLESWPITLRLPLKRRRHR